MFLIFFVFNVKLCVWLNLVFLKLNELGLIFLINLLVFIFIICVLILELNVLDIVFDILILVVVKILCWIFCVLLVCCKGWSWIEVNDMMIVYIKYSVIIMVSVLLIDLLLLDIMC